MYIYFIIAIMNLALICYYVYKNDWNNRLESTIWFCFWVLLFRLSTNHIDTTKQLQKIYELQTTFAEQRIEQQGSLLDK